MVLAREDDAFHAAGLQRLDYLFCVEIGWIEDGRTLVAVSPLLVRKRIRGEMKECVGLHLVPLELTVGWHSAKGGRWRDIPSSFGPSESSTTAYCSPEC